MFSKEYLINPAHNEDLNRISLNFISWKHFIKNVILCSWSFNNLYQVEVSKIPIGFIIQHDNYLISGGSNSELQNDIVTFIMIFKSW